MNSLYSLSMDRRVKRRASTEGGMSLVEMMIGLAIGLTLTLGLITLIANSSATFKTQDDFSAMQENATAALRYIGDSVRLAGFYGYTADPTVITNTGVNINAPPSDCGSGVNPPAANWAVNLDPMTPIFGFAGLLPNTVTGILPCIDQANFATGLGANPNPILITRGAGGFRIPDPDGDGNVTDGIQAQQNWSTRVFLQATANRGILFYGNDFAALRVLPSALKFTNGNDMDVFEYQIHVYYIRPCSKPAGASINCTGAGDDNGNPIRTLVRQELSAGSMVEVPLVEGIEMMNIQYGIDKEPASAQDGVPEFFTQDPAPTNDWRNVVAVKVTLLVRSPAIGLNYDDSAKTYDLDGDGVVDYRCTDYAAPACKYKRKVFSQTFQARNIADRRGQ